MNKQSIIKALPYVAAAVAVAAIAGYKYKNRKSKKRVDDLSKNSERFRGSVLKSKDLKNLSSEERLILYGLYKQAVFGDCNIVEPNIMYFEEHAKWEAWISCQGVDKQEAEQKYSQLVDLMTLHGGSGTQNEMSSGLGLKVSTMQPAIHDTNEEYQKLINKEEFKGELVILSENEHKLLKQLVDSIGNVNKLKELLEKQDNVTLKRVLSGEGDTQVTLLHSVIDNGDMDCFSIVLSYYKRYELVNIQESVSGMTPLHYACLNENGEMVRQLMGAGGDPLIKDLSGDDAMATGNAEMCQIMSSI